MVWSVESAAQLLPASCLVQSLALERLLVAQGVPARLRIGVARDPFDAHAWVETPDGPLTDAEGYVPLPHLE